MKLTKLFLILIMCLCGRVSFAQSNIPGLIDNYLMNLPAQLWYDDTAFEASKSINHAQISHNILINRLRLQIILAGVDRPISDEKADAVNFSRLGYLERIGALDEAQSLVNLLDISAPQMQKQVENIAVLSGRPESYCQKILDKQSFEVEAGVLAYCALRLQSWDEAIAAYALSAPRMSPERNQLMRVFLGLDEADYDVLDKPWQSLPEPFDFVLGEGLAKERGEARLPASYHYFLRSTGAPPRVMLNIYEDLVLNASLPPAHLFSAYRSHKSAESGGAWGRAQIVQKLDRLSAQEYTPESLAQWLEQAYARFDEVHLFPLIAQETGNHFGHITPDFFPSFKSQMRYTEFALTGGWAEPQWVEIIDYPEEILLAFHLQFGAVIQKPLKAQNFQTRIGKILYHAYFGDVQNAPLTRIDGLNLWQSIEIISNIEQNSDQDIERAFRILAASGQGRMAKALAINLLTENSR